MDVEQIAELRDDLNYILARISKYLKNNQYVYLRTFDSWKDGYNSIADQLNTDRTIRVPIFKLSPIDYSPTGKSIKSSCVDRLVKTINRQVIRLEDRIAELKKAAEVFSRIPHSLAKFFPPGPNGETVIPPVEEKLAFVAIPPDEANRNLYREGVLPPLMAGGLTAYCADRPLADDETLGELCLNLYACRLAIFDLAGQAANVMFALGLAYGLDKPVVILQRQPQAGLGDRHNSSILCFSDAASLREALGKLLNEWPGA